MLDMTSFNENMLPTLKPFTGPDVLALRAKIGVSRPVFAKIFNVSVSAVRSWEGREDSALSGGDLVVANQLNNKGLLSYLNGSSGGIADPELGAAAYDLLTGAKLVGKEYRVSPEVIEGIKAALGLRTPLDNQAAMIKQIQGKAVEDLASDVMQVISDAKTLEAAQEALMALVTKSVISL
jgi:DNA-binding transcriptional regulator YiaG